MNTCLGLKTGAGSVEEGRSWLPKTHRKYRMLVLFIIVAVVAIVVYSAEHNLATLGQFVDYVQHDTLTVMMVLNNKD